MKHSGLTPNATTICLLFSLLLTEVAAGCHGDTDQGGATDRAHASQPATRAAPAPKVPTPPSADQMDPDSPRAVLNGTSTTQPAMPRSSRNAPR